MITAKASSPGRTMLGMEAAWVPREADPQARSEGEASFGAPAGYKDPLCTEGDSKCQQDESRGLSPRLVSSISPAWARGGVADRHLWGTVPVLMGTGPLSLPTTQPHLRAAVIPRQSQCHERGVGSRRGDSIHQAYVNNYLLRIYHLKRRTWQPTPVFLPGESHGQRSVTGYIPQGRKSRARTK